MSGSFSHYGPRPPKEHKAVHQDGGIDELSCAGLAGRSEFVLRANITAYDFTRLELSVTGTFTDLDCSGIVPAGATAILFQIETGSNSVSKALVVRSKGDTNIYPRFHFVCVQTATGVYSQQWCACDVDRIVQYYVEHVDVIITNVIIAGWRI